MNPQTPHDLLFRTLAALKLAGFRTDQKQAFGGAHAGWKTFFDKPETTLEKAIS